VFLLSTSEASWSEILRDVMTNFLNFDYKVKKPLRLSMISKNRT
jgi:hypothetical protein